MGNDEIPHKEPHARLHIGHVNASYHTRYRYKSHPRERCAHHTESHHIPGRLAVSAKESVVIRPATRCFSHYK